LLATYNPDLQEVDMSITAHRPSNRSAWFEARTVVHLPTGKLAAHAEEPVAEAAVDRVADEIVAKVRRHKELVRRDFIFKRKRAERANLKAAALALERHAKSGQQEEFFKVLRPLLRFLGDHARRELRSMELGGLLHRGEVTVADVMDEVLTLAGQRFNTRPKHMALDTWLIDLLHDALEKFVKQEPRPHVSLQEKAEKVLPPRKRSDEDEEWWAELLGQEEELTLADLIPDPELTDVWDQLTKEERCTRLVTLFNELPTARRQAFLLNALEDFSPAEIAAIQSRPESEVTADIEAARETLRDRMMVDGHLSEQRSAMAAHARRC
jgi:DNA-directed RNA polymerase specialized sigma24 family protein/ribosome-associated translation inhibitor RaiA